MRKIRKLAIANRGEVAVRIIRACEELGITPVLLHSDADVNSVAYRLAKEKICIGPAPVAESYLHIEANVRGALSAGADAIHPGFGFLSENSDFARACIENKLIFVGPSPACIDLLGDKMAAKALVEKIGVATVPGYRGIDQSISRLLEEAKAIGFPVIVKAAAGGGGRGMKVIRNAAEAPAQIESAQREGLAAFASDHVFLEKYLERAKHIEFQVFGDSSGRVIHLFDRECSVQRRHQKIIEEAPSPSLDEALRDVMGAAAVAIAREAGYVGAGTVEFLLQDGQFFFLEMNTRLQVEHPVTEMVLGVDLVKAQILVADGAPLPWREGQLKVTGHAIEGRVYAEDPYRNGLPSVGKLAGVHWPQGPGRRFEVGFAEGDEITSYYDSMIAKIIVWDESRPRAIQKFLRVIEDVVIFGLQSNIPYLQAIVEHPDFISGKMTTKFIEQHFPAGLEPRPLRRDELLFAREAYRKVREAVGFAEGGPAGAVMQSPWQIFWRSV